MSSRRWAWRALQIVLLAVVGYFMYRRLAPELSTLTWSDLEQYSPALPTLAASVILLIAVYLMHALLWRHLSHRLGGTRLSTRDTLYVYFISGLGRYLPGKLWQIAGLAMLAQRAGLAPVAATAAAVIGQLAFITSGMVLLAIVLPTQYGGAAALSAIGLAALGVMLYLLGNTVRGRAVRQRVLQRFGPRVADAGALLDRVSGTQALGWTLAYALSWVVLGIAFALFVIAFDANLTRHTLHFVGTAAASYLIGYLLFTPGGIGVREASMYGLLQLVMPPAPALLIAAASRIWFTVGELAPLALVPVLPRASAPRAA